MVAYPLLIVVLGMVYWVCRPIVWAAIYMEPYQPPPGPYSPNSGEWLFVQGIGFGASVVAGIAAAYWSPAKSKLPIAVLVVLSFAALLFAQFPFDTSAIRNAVYALHMPLGLVVGALLLKRWQANMDGESGLVMTFSPKFVAMPPNNLLQPTVIKLRVCRRLNLHVVPL